MDKEIAILMAAGMGTRMRPLTASIPKPLVNVHGKPMIESVIDGLSRRGIKEIYIVTGYLGEQFQYLREKYYNISLIENTDYDKINNISSIYAATDILINTISDVFICEADLFVKDGSVFDIDLDRSGYFGKMIKGWSDDWVFELDDNGFIQRVGKGGNDCFNMVGVSFFKNKDVHRLAELIRNTYGTEGFEDLFWDDVVDRNLKELELIVHEVKEGQIIEIDTVEELAAEDTTYRNMMS